MCTQLRRCIQPWKPAPELPRRWGTLSHARRVKYNAPCVHSQGGKCAGSLMDSWCHLLHCAVVISRVNQQHWLYLCLSPPSLVFALRLQETTCCCRGEWCHGFVTVVIHESALLLCAIKDLVFMFTAFNRDQTQQPRLGNGCPPRVQWHTCYDEHKSWLFLEEDRGDWKGPCVPQDKTDFPKSLLSSSPIWEVTKCQESL